MTRYAWFAAAGMTVVLSGCASEPMTAPNALAHAINTNLMPQTQSQNTKLHPMQVITVPVPSTDTMDSEMAAWQRWQQEHAPKAVILPTHRHPVHRAITLPKIEPIQIVHQSPLALPIHPIKAIAKSRPITMVKTPSIPKKINVTHPKKPRHSVELVKHAIDYVHPIKYVHHQMSKKSVVSHTSAANPMLVHHAILPETRLISQTPAQPKVRNLYTKRLDTIFREWEGTPYVYGGTTRRGIDCSAFVQVVYRAVYHYDLPRTTLQQVKLGRRIRPENIQQGDLIFFHTGPDTRHVGVYVADGEFMESSSSRGVIISELSNPYWRQHFWQIRRIV
jgi:cell wall-associated NlpC family hydrolase